MGLVKSPAVCRDRISHLQTESMSHPPQLKKHHDKRYSRLNDTMHLLFALSLQSHHPDRVRRKAEKTDNGSAHFQFETGTCPRNRELQQGNPNA